MTLNYTTSLIRCENMWGDSPMIFSRDCVTCENYWRITPPMTTNIVIKGGPYTILYFLEGRIRKLISLGDLVLNINELYWYRKSHWINAASKICKCQHIFCHQTHWNRGHIQFPWEQFPVIHLDKLQMHSQKTNGRWLRLWLSQAAYHALLFALNWHRLIICVLK